jgi:Domain of unknown function (DUF5668)
VVGPLILIFIGAVFLLENTGYLPPNFWVNLWRLWPLILVLAGAELLLSHRVPWPALAGVAAVVLIVGSVMANSHLAQVTPAGAVPTAPPTEQTTLLQGASQATVTVRFGAGALNIAALNQLQPDQLARMSYQGPPNLAPVPRYQLVNGDVGQLEYSSSGRPGPGFVIPFIDGRREGQPRVDLSFAPAVPITSFIIQAGATDAHLDLSDLRIDTLDMSVGAATVWVRLPQSGVTNAHISGGASNITLEIPHGVAARIQYHGGLSTLNVDQTRFPQADEGVFRSADYDTNPNRVGITLETGLTTIQVS